MEVTLELQDKLSTSSYRSYQLLKAWPHARENHTQSCDDFRELSSDQPHTRQRKHIINSP